MDKDTRPPWHGHRNTIAKIAGCSTTTVTKILNGKAGEATTNQELIKTVKKIASDLLIRDAKILIQRAQEKQDASRALVA